MYPFSIIIFDRSDTFLGLQALNSLSRRRLRTVSTLDSIFKSVFSSTADINCCALPLYLKERLACHVFLSSLQKIMALQISAYVFPLQIIFLIITRCLEFFPRPIATKFFNILHFNFFWPTRWYINSPFKWKYLANNITNYFFLIVVLLFWPTKIWCSSKNVVSKFREIILSRKKSVKRERITSLMVLYRNWHKIWSPKIIMNA